MSQNLAISNIQVNGQSVSTEPFSILAGDLFDVSWTVSNLGDQTIVGGGNSATHLDSVYLSDDDVLSLDDVLIGSYNGTTGLGANPDSYNRNQRVSISTNVLWWQSPLNKYLIFQTNSSGSVTESDQTDNIVLVPITISSIDLSLEYATVSVAGNGYGGDSIAGDSLEVATVGSGRPVNIVAGQSIDLSWQVRNIGNVDVNTGYTDRIYLSKDAVLDANDLSLLTVSRSSLLSNQSYTGFGSVSVPTGIFGSAYILFDTDGNKQVAEGDESNNSYAAPVFVLKDPPDLTVTSVTAPTEANIGQAITVSWTVNNSGLGSTYAPWYDKVYLSDDSILGADDQDLTYRYNADAIAAGASYSQNNIQVYLPDNAAGSKYLLFATDEIVNFYAASLSTSSTSNIGNLFESNEANNVFFQQINIKAPDLSPVSLLSSTTTTALGSTINVGWSVKNQGQVATTRSWYDRLVLSNDMVYDSNDIALAETYQNATLGINESYQVGLDTGSVPTRQVFIPTNIKGGSNYLLLVNDVYHSQGELNETNNIAALAINIAAPDLIVTSATAPTTAIIGENILVNWTVQNSGNLATSNSYWYDRIYVSSDLTLDAQDTYLGNRYNSQPLAVNGSYGVVDNSVNISNTALGDRYLLFVANYGKEQGELNFNNNTYAVPITLTAPDLVVSQVSTLANAAVGDSVAVSWSVKNQGTVSTSVGSWYDQVYLSDDEFLGNDISLGSFYRDNSSGLTANAEYNATTNVVLPSYSVGNKYILVVADAYNNYQSETNENNNFKFTSKPIAIAAPNLTITATALASTTLGQATSVTWTVSNASGTTANANWFDRVYLSSDQNLDGSDTLLTSESINAQTPISGGGQYSVTKDTTITGNNAGSRYLIFAADRDANQIETNETDNQFVVPITVVTNDLRADSVTTNSPAIEFGNPFDITWAVTNIGVGNASGTWGDRIFLSHDNILSADDIALSTQNKTANLFTGNSYSTTASVKVERTNPLPVDVNGFVSEVEQNDSISFALDLKQNFIAGTGNSYIAKAKGAISSGSDGDYYKFSASPSDTLKLNVSNYNGAIPYPSISLYDRNGQYLASYYNYSGYSNANLSYTLSSTSYAGEYYVRVGSTYGYTGNYGLTVDIKTDTPFLPTVNQEGDYYVIVQSDVNNVLPEGDETNNIIVSSSKVSLTSPTNRPDLTITGSITDNLVLTGSVVPVSWTVTNASLTSIAQSGWFDYVYLSDDNQLDSSDIVLKVKSRSSDLPALAATGSYSIASENISLPTGVIGTKYLLFATDNNGDRLESNENNNISAVQIKIAVPDLTVTTIGTVPTTAILGGSIPLSWRVTNNGNIAASANWYDAIYISSNQAIDNGDTLLSSFLATSQTPLAIDASYDLSRSVVVNDVSRLTGQQYLIIKTDASNVQVDSNKNNNTVIIPITFSAPDLVVTATNSPTSALLGESVALSWTVTNNSTVTAPVSYTYDTVYLSDDQVLDYNDILLTSRLATSPNTPLTGGSSYTATQSAIIPGTTVGNKFLLFATDRLYSYESGNQGETNEDNNIVAVPISLSAPDIVASNISTVPGILSSQPVELVWTDTNQGNAPANGSWVDKIYLSSDDNIGNDIFVGSLNFIGNIAAGQSIERRQTVNVPLNLDGSYRFVVVANVNSQVTESIIGQQNNASIDDQPIQIQINAPDLTITNIGAIPTSVVLGEQLALSWQVTNNGDSSANSDWFDYIYLSDDQILDNTDVNIATYATGSNTPLPVGSSYIVNQNVVISNTLGENKFLLFAVDGSKNQIETNENNNVRAIPISLVAPDLVVSNITSTQETALAGQQVEVAWIVRNQGVAVANGSWTDRVYLSSDNGIGSDIAVGDFSFTGNVASGQSVNRRQTITVPIALKGSYHFVVESDVYSQLPEGVTNDSNNASIGAKPIDIFGVETLSPNLQVTSVTVPPIAFSSQETVVQWQVTNSGNGSTTTPTWSDQVWLSLDQTIDRGDTLLGTVANASYLNAGESYLSSLTARLPLGINANYYFLVKTDAGFGVVAESQESDNVSVGGPASIQLTPPPDFQVSIINASAQGFSGQPLSLSWTVKNAGNGKNIETAWYDEVFISTDNTLDAADKSLGRVDHRGTINPGESYTADNILTSTIINGERYITTKTFDLPIGVSGDFFIFVRTDAGNQVYENVFDLNNTGYDAIKVNLTPPPDLEVEFVNAPVVALASHALNINYKVINAGATATPKNSSWSDVFYLSADDQLDSGDLRLGEQYHGEILAVGDSYTVSTSFTLSDNIVGSYYLFAVADGSDNVFELDNNNNKTKKTLPIEILSLPANLTVSAVTAPDIGVSNKAIRIGWKVTNQGTGDTAVAGWSDSIVASIDNIIGNGDDRLLAEFAHNDLLNPGGVYSRQELVTVPYDLIGQYQLFVVADYRNNVYEATNEQDNAASKAINIVRQTADLQVTNVASSVTAVSGDPLNVSWTVQNRGEGQTNSDYWYDKVYLSTDKNISDDDLILGEVYHSGSLSASAQYNVSLDFDVPVTTSGQFYTIVSTDTKGYVLEEPAESNNNLSANDLSKIALRKTDLVFTDITAPTITISGQSIDIGWTIQNTGVNSTTNRSVWYDSFYLSRDQIFDRNSDIYIGSKSHETTLAAGASYTDSASFDIAQGLSGSFYVLGVTDARDRIYEANAENNNVTYDVTPTQVVITQPADLIVDSISTATSAVPGQNTSISYTVVNQGVNSALGRWTDAVYVSTDGVWDVNDALLGRVEHNGTVISGDSYTGSLTAPLPGVLPGNYQIIVRSDIRNQAIESNETNNAKASLTPIAVDAERLQLGVVDSSTLAKGESVYYKVEVAEGETLVVTFDSSSSDAFNELYVSRDEVPSRSKFDFAAIDPFHPDQRVVIPGTAAGTYYIRAYGNENTQGAAPFTIKAELAQFGVFDTTFGKGGNVGNLTVEINGTRFDRSVKVRLLDESGVDRAATSMFYHDETKAFATFNLVGLSAGKYDVVVEKSDGSRVTVNDGLEVVAGGGEKFLTQISGANRVRQNSVFPFAVEWGNGGLNDMVAPLLLVENSIPFGLTTASNAEYSSYTFLGLNSGDGPPGIIRPGQRESRLFFSNANVGSPGSTTYTATVDRIYKDPDALFDWGSVRAQLQPSNQSDAEFQPVFDQLIAQVGRTNGDYLKMLARNSALVSGTSGSSDNTGVLLDLERKKAQSVLGTSISGMLKAEKLGVGISAKTVIAKNVLTNQSFEVSSLEDGSFIFDGLSAGSYTFSVGLAIITSDPITIQLPFGQRSENLKLVISNGATISGVIKDSSAQIFIYQNEEIVGFSHSDHDGKFSINGLKSGNYIVEAFLGESSRRISKSITIGDQENATVDISSLDTSGEVSLNISTIPAGELIDGYPLELIKELQKKLNAHAGYKSSLDESYFYQARSRVISSYPTFSPDTNNENIINIYFQTYLDIIEEADAPRIESIAKWAGGPETEKLYKKYFELTSPIPYDQIQYKEGEDLSNRFKSASTTRATIDIIQDKALAAIKKAYGNLSQFSSLRTCDHPELNVYFDIEKLGIDNDQEKYIFSEGRNSFWKYDPLTEGAAGALAGSNGTGGLEGSIDIYSETKDSRTVRGTVLLHVPANSVLAHLYFNLNVKVHDTLDFAPGNVFKNLLFPEGFFTNLQQLELNYHAYDVPFTIDFKAETGKRNFWLNTPFNCDDDNPHDDMHPFLPNNPHDGTHPFSLVNSSDPNDIVGPKGSGTEKWVSASAPLSYTIHFENDPKVASAPAQHVRVTQKLDSDLDFRTFRVGDFGFGEVFIDVPENRAFYQTRLDLIATQGILVDVTAGIDTITGEAFWEFSSIDPTTGEAPTDPLKGFLPPNLLPPEGDGFVNYSVKAKSTAATGSVIDAQARIVFDSNEPIDTPAIFNTIDRLAPTSTVSILTPATTTPEFTITWAGSDDANGSAIASYTVYVSDNSSAYTPWLSDTTLTEASYIGDAGHTYKFYSVATDNAGNIQASVEAQATIQLAGGTGSIGNFVWTDTNGDGFQNQGELGLSNVTVNLYNSAASLVATTTTSATGIYNFADIATGEYSLEFAAPSGYLFSAADRGTNNDAIDSDANPANGRTNTFTVNAGENSSWDAGLYQQASISGTNWQDTNGNGAKDANETIGLAGWTVYLDANENGTLEPVELSTTTDTNGSYSFSNLHPGNYTIAQITKPAWLQTYPRIQVTTTASDIELFTPEIELDVSTASSTPTKPITSLVDLNGFWQTPRFSNIKGQGLSTVIIDTGIDLDHSIFGADIDGNGVADRIVYQYDFADNDADASDRTGHGSHVTSIAAQIAPDANLIVLKVFKDNQTGSFTYLEKALQWVNQNVATYNIASVNLSLGDSRNWNTTNPRYGIGDEIAAISAQNVIIAAASGNNFYQFNSAAGVSYPAADPNTIAVGAVWSEDFGGPQKFGNGAIDYSTGADRIASFSQRDVNLLDVFAPGVFVNGANATGGTQSLGGTSQATPFVSGIAVLAQQIALEKLGRKLTVAEFRKLLDDTSTIIQDGDDENDNVANTNLKYPRINLLNLAQGVANFSGSPTDTGVITPPIIGGSTPSPNVVGTTQILTHSVTLASGETLTNQDFGNQQIKSVISGTNQPDYLTGTAGNDTINGLDGNDYLKGGTGNDYLDGGIGNDVLEGSDDSNGLDTFAGGAGDDAYGIYNSATVIVENADEGIDTVWTAVNYALTDNIENMYLVGDIAGTGNDDRNLIIGYGVGDNTIYGLGGDDTIYGGEGNDHLNGGTGNDYLDGGIGNDVLEGSGDSDGLDTFAGGAGDDAYGIYNSATVVVENADGGTDTVWTQVNYALTDNVENMYLVGDISGTGNDNSNIIIGYGIGDNTIYGLGGDDTISGGLGANTLFGGAGDDTFILSTTSSDTISDFGIGSDLLRISASDFGGGLTANVALLTTQLSVGSDITTASSTAQRFIFNTTNGDLFFDADGSSSNFTAVKIANLSNISSLKTESFLLG